MTAYDERDVAIMANVVFHGLCELDEEGRRNNEDPIRQNIGPLAEEVGAIGNKVHVAYLVEHALLPLGFIERGIRSILLSKVKTLEFSFASRSICYLY